MVADIDAAVEVVWRYLTAGRGAWWPEMRFEAAVGSPLVETWVEGDRQMSATGSVTRCDASHVLGFSWSEQSWDHPLEVVIELEAHGQGTFVTLTESAFSRARTPYSLPVEHDEGWRYHLARLKLTSEGEVVDVDVDIQ